MWTIKLNESTNLSKETVGLCIANGVETLQNLFDCYFSESKFDNLKYLSDENKSELTAFCEEIIHFIEARLEKREEELEESIDPTIIENLSIENLLDQGIISNRLFNTLKSAGLIDFERIAAHYKKHQTFLNLSRVGYDKNSEAKNLLEKYTLRIPEVDIQTGQSPPNEKVEDNLVGNINWNEYTGNKAVFLEYLDQRKSEISNWLYHYFVRVLASIDTRDFAEEIQHIYNSPQKYGDHIGVGKVSQIQNFINRSARFVSGNTKQSASHLLLEQFQSNKIELDINSIEEFWINSKNPFKLMDLALAKYGKMDFKDHIILSRVNTAKYFINDIRLSYEEVQDQLSQILGKEVPRGTIRPWVSRAKENFAEFVNSYCAVIDMRDFIVPLLEEHNGIKLLRETTIHDLNSKYGVSFGKPVYNLLVQFQLPELIPSFNLRRDQLSNLYFLDTKEFDEIELTSALNSVFDASNKVTPKEIRHPLDGSMELKSSVKSILELEEIEFRVDGQDIIFPPTKERRPNKVDAIIKILEEEGEAMHYDDLAEEVNRRHSGLFTSYRGPKDALHSCDKTMSLGGRSNYYILTAWKDKYFYGGLKDLLYEFYSAQQGPRHYHAAYIAIKDKKLPSPDIEAIHSTLLQLDEVFKSNRNKFFSLQAKNFDQVMGIQINTTHHSFTDKVLTNMSVDDARLSIEKHFPGIHPDQVDYLIWMAQNRRK